LSTQPSLARVRVLIADDNAPMRLLIRTALHALGCQAVLEASDGLAALEFARTSGPDLALIDYVMPGMDGIEFTKAIRDTTSSPNPFLPIILLTGHANAESVRRARDSGVTEILAKPFTTKGLFDRIAAVVDRPRPFVRTRSYFGPCRRRRSGATYQGPERRETPPTEAAA
jgi:CheY-like chemotaxis protein